jgi:hypothetical protein
MILAEHQQAVAWRESLGLTQEKLGGLIGYATATVYWMERGLTAPRRGRRSEPVPAHVWLRYKRACAGLDAEARGRRVFGWEPWSKG